MKNNLVKVETEDKEELNLLILEEFEYKKKKYALLTEIDKDCHCDDECDCEDNCDCKNGGECTCGDDCHCDDESLFILEITKDEKGNEIFKSVDDDKLFEELIKKTEKILG